MPALVRYRVEQVQRSLEMALVHTCDAPSMSSRQHHGQLHGTAAPAPHLLASSSSNTHSKILMRRQGCHDQMLTEFLSHSCPHTRMMCAAFA